MLSERDTQIQRLEAQAAAAQLFADWRREHKGKRAQPKPAQAQLPAPQPTAAPDAPPMPVPSGDY